MSSKEIAHALDISPKTVEAHLQRLFDRHGVRTRARLVAKWLSISPEVYSQVVDSV